MKKKMSILEIFLNENDVLEKNKNLKFNIQQLFQLLNVLEKQMKHDDYREAIQTLMNVSALSKQVQQQLQVIIQKSELEVKTPDIQHPNKKTISNEEI